MIETNCVMPYTPVHMAQKRDLMLCYTGAQPHVVQCPYTHMVSCGSPHPDPSRIHMVCREKALYPFKLSLFDSSNRNLGGPLRIVLSLKPLQVVTCCFCPSSHRDDSSLQLPNPFSRHPSYPEAYHWPALICRLPVPHQSSLLQSSTDVAVALLIF